MLEAFYQTYQIFDNLEQFFNCDGDSMISEETNKACKVRFAKEVIVQGMHTGEGLIQHL